MNLPTIALASSLVLLATATVVRITVPEPVPQPAAPQEGAPDGVTLRNVLKRNYSPAAPLPPADARPGMLTFVLEEGVELRGFASAHMCPRDEHAGPSFMSAQSVVAMQTADALLLEPWVAEREPLEQGANWFVYFSLWLDTPRGPEWRTGWAEVGLHDLIATGVVVRPRRNVAVTVTVSTANGQPAPGALVSVDDSRYGPGRFHQYAFTGEDGTVLVSGLEEDREWRFALAEGLGPDQTPVMAVASVPATSHVTLESPLTGDWTYRRHHLRPAIRGGSFHIDKIETLRGRMAPMWSTAAWIGPGRNPWRPLYLMSRSDVPMPPKIRLTLRDYAVAEIPTDEEARIAFEFDPAAEEAQATRRSPAGRTDATEGR